MAIVKKLFQKLFFRVSIRTKIVVMILSMSAVFGSGILFFIYFQLNKTLTLETINKTLILVDGLSAKAAGPMQAEDINGLQLIIGEAISQPDVAYCFIKDGKGR